MRGGRVILFAKVPKIGRVKTRLARGMGSVPATWWFRRQLRARIRALGDPRWALELAVSPDAEGERSALLPSSVPRRGQGRGDLGARMARALRSGPPGPVIVAGCDIPDLSRRQIAAAFRALGGADAVFGPAEDGGYYLIGLSATARRACSGFLKGVRWSGPHALADSVATLRGRRVALIETLADVDEAADLAALSPPSAP